MVRASQPGEKIIETWEATCPGTVFVAVYDKREDKYENKPVSLSSTKRIRLTRDDRLYNQERVPDENEHLDPFLNGLLRRVDNGPDDKLDRTNQLTEDELGDMLAVTDPESFQARIAQVGSELVLRRLLAAAEEDGRVWQVDSLREHIKERFPAAAGQRTIREIDEEEHRRRLGR